MNYHVIWKAVAEQKLADMWNHSQDRGRVAAAADSFDAAVQREPLNVGESRAGRTRVAFEGPLGFVFDVFPDSRRVVVKAVWRVRP
jgi:hypothetical protein